MERATLMEISEINLSHLTKDNIDIVVFAFLFSINLKSALIDRAHIFGKNNQERHINFSVEEPDLTL